MSRTSDFFYKFQGVPLSVGAELGVSLGGPQACMPHQLADGVQRDILTGQPRAKGMSQGVDNDFEPGIGDAVVQAKNVYGLRKGMGQGIGPDLKPFCRSEDEIGWSDWDNGLQYVDNRIVHERGALSHFPIDMDEAVLKVDILTAHTEHFSHPHSRVHGNERNAVYAAGEYFEDIEQPLQFNRCKKSLPLVVRGKQFDFRGRAGMKAPFDHAPYDVEDIKEDKVDRRRRERVSSRQDFACFCLADGFFGQQSHLEGFKAERGDVFQEHVFKDGLDVNGIVMAKRLMVFQQREALFSENFPRTAIGQRIGFGWRGKLVGMAAHTDTFRPDFTCQDSGIAFAFPAYFFPDQLWPDLVCDFKTDVSFPEIAFRLACASVDASVLCLITQGHLCLPFANQNSEMLTQVLTRRAYATMLHAILYIATIYGCIVQQAVAKSNQSSMMDASMSTCINHFCNFLLMTFLFYL